MNTGVPFGNLRIQMCDFVNDIIAGMSLSYCKNTDLSFGKSLMTW